MSKYIAYKKDGEFDLDEGFIDQSCFKWKTNKEIKKIFAKDGFDLEIIDQDKFLELTSNQIDPIKIAKTKKYDEIETLRKSYQFAPIIYQDLEFSTSILARQNIIGIISILKNNPELSSHYWKDNDDKECNFILSDFENLLAIISKRDSKLYYIEAQLNNEISKNSDPIILEEINIKESWKSFEASYSK